MFSMRIVHEIVLVIVGLSASTSLYAAKGEQEASVKLMNANIASDYVVINAPTNRDGCPFLGFLRILPGGNLTGILVLDMARSKAKLFTGKYTISDGRHISFKSDDPTVQLSNIDGSLFLSETADPRKPPLDRLTLLTETSDCGQQIYKFAPYEQEE